MSFFSLILSFSLSSLYLLLTFLSKNQEYPSTQDIANRCINMLAQLYHSPAVDADGNGDAIGAPTVGSSEAIMLCGLSMKKRWQERRKAQGLDYSTPNLVMATATHVCWEKLCRYWDIETRYIPASAAEERWAATPDLIANACDENTIGVVCILGSTYTGEFEDVEGMDAKIEEVNKKNGWNIVIHVDGASGAMVAPFIYPDVKFDFRLKNVASINISGHKYGLVLPGLGWAIWRSEEYLHESLVFWCDYLGNLERSITLNFSRSASNVVAQYYQLLRLGRDGYTKIMSNLANIAKYVRDEIQGTGHFDIVSKDIGVPLVAFKLKMRKHADGTVHHRMYDEFQIAERLRIAGWVIPAYSMPAGAEEVKLMRITIREDFSMSMASAVVGELKGAVDWLEKHFTLTREDMELLAGVALGKKMSRLDSSLMSGLKGEKVVVKPC